MNNLNVKETDKNSLAVIHPNCSNNTDDVSDCSPGRAAVLDLEQGSNVVQMMREAGIDAPTAFFDSIQGKEID
eukprot:3931841-Rhodomonas_salina.2